MLNDTVLTIFMVGLMTHIGDDTVGGRYVKKAAALVADRYHQHQAGMVIFDSNLPGDFSIYVFQHGDHVEFKDGVTHGDAEATDKFERFTPTLFEPLTNSLVDEPVKELRDHGAVVAWIHYPKGTLDINGLKTDEGRFFRGNDLVRTQCVPAATIFGAPTHENVNIIITHANGTTHAPIEVSPEAFILIVNEPSLTTTTRRVAESLHFTNYSDLLERRFGVIRRSIARVEVGNPCLEQDALPRGKTLGDVLTTFFQARQASGASKHAFDPNSLSTVHGSHAAFSLENLAKILVADDPACTNTDWP